MEFFTSESPLNKNRQQKVDESEWCKRLFEWVSNIRKSNIGISYFTSINPYSLEVNEWARRVKELEWLRKEQSKTQNPDE